MIRPVHSYVYYKLVPWSEAVLKDIWMLNRHSVSSRMMVLAEAW